MRTLSNVPATVLTPGPNVCGRISRSPTPEEEGFVLLVREPRIEHFDQLRRCSGVVCERGGANDHPAVLCRIWSKPLLEVEAAAELFQEGESVTLLPRRAEICRGDASVVEEDRDTLDQFSQFVDENDLRFQVSVVDELDILRTNANATVARRIDQFFIREELLWVKHGREPFSYLQWFGREAVIDFLAGEMRKGIAALQLGQTLNFRSLDMRSDEPPVPGELGIEANPHLGNHGIRRTLREGGPFLELELAALCRLNEAERSRIVFSLPFVVEEAEVRECERLIDQFFAGQIELGVFVETPAAVSELRPILASGRVQLVSIGTKDLTQMLLACDRGNPAVRHLYSPLKRPVLAAIRSVMADCRASQVPAILFASPDDIPALLEQVPGVDRFSVCCGELLTLLGQKDNFSELTEEDALLWIDLGVGD